MRAFIITLLFAMLLISCDLIDVGDQGDSIISLLQDTVNGIIYNTSVSDIADEIGNLLPSTDEIEFLYQRFLGVEMSMTDEATDADMGTLEERVKVRIIESTDNAYPFQMELTNLSQSGADPVILGLTKDPGNLTLAIPTTEGQDPTLVTQDALESVKTGSEIDNAIGALYSRLFPEEQESPSAADKMMLGHLLLSIFEQASTQRFLSTE